MITAAEIAAKIGNLNPRSTTPGAWWVGTELAKQRADSLQEKHDQRWTRWAEIAEEFRLNPEKVWSASRHDRVTAVEPIARETPVYLRENPNGHGFVPDRRRRIGKELASAIHKFNDEHCYNPLEEIGGTSGKIRRFMPDGRIWQSGFGLHHNYGYYPCVFLNENPDDNPHAEGIEVDPLIWQRVPISTYFRIMENHHA